MIVRRCIETIPPRKVSYALNNFILMNGQFNTLTQPIANNDSYAVELGSELMVNADNGVLANDTGLTDEETTIISLLAYFEYI